jgi:hypothetical protein
MKNRTHSSFRREATFRAEPHRLDLGILDRERETDVRREDLGPGCYLLHGMMSPKECRALVETAERLGFSHAGLAVGDDTQAFTMAVRRSNDLAWSGAMALLAATSVTCSACAQSGLGMSMAADSVDPPRETPEHEEDAGEACEVGTVTGDVYGRVTYFRQGAFLPAGRYRVAYVDGCMKYSGRQDWAVHASLGSNVGSDNWQLVSGARKVVVPPGSVGFVVGSGGFDSFAHCVAANAPLAPVEFDFAGGPVGLWLQDEPYGDNLPGDEGRSPTWRLVMVGPCRPAFPSRRG